MKTEKFESILNERINKCVKVLCAKADEYATEDRLHNFKVARTVSLYLSGGDK